MQERHGRILHDTVLPGEQCVWRFEGGQDPLELPRR